MLRIANSCVRYKSNGVFRLRSASPLQHPPTPPSFSAMSIPFIPVSPRTAARNIANKMSLVREGLMARGEYLADPTIMDRVTWEPYGSGHRLVITPPAPHTPDSHNDTPPPDNTNTAATKQSGDRSPTPDDTAETPAVDTPADPSTPAILTIVTQLVPGQSWLYPNGRWTGPAGYADSIVDVKLLCTGGTPTHPQFINDYSTSIANLKAIMARVGDPRNERKSVVQGPTNLIRMRHQLFMVRPLASCSFSDADIWLC